jgi:hypothetical protein
MTIYNNMSLFNLICILYKRLQRVQSYQHTFLNQFFNSHRLNHSIFSAIYPSINLSLNPISISPLIHLPGRIKTMSFFEF